MKTTCRFGVCLLALAGLFGCGAAWGQTNGAIRGIVKDPSGAVVPGATVTVTLGTDTSARQLPTRTARSTFPSWPSERTMSSPKLRDSRSSSSKTWW